MNTPHDRALDAAAQIADGGLRDPALLEEMDAALARSFRTLSDLFGHARDGGSWGRLRDLEHVARGGFGDVYRAWDTTLDRLVALKLRRGDASDGSTERDLVAEARRLARVRHPHVLAVHGAGHHEGRTGLWTDWIEGTTLAALLAQGKPFPPALRLQSLIDLADAVAAVHAAGIVHGDIKPANVMLDTHSRLLLMDFGAGFDASEEGAPMRYGTPAYLAPEAASGAAAGPAVDVYALGVLAHQMCTGRLPAEEGGDTGIRPVALRTLLRRMRAREPSARPDAGTVAAALRDIAALPQRRLRRTLVAVAGLALALIAATASIGLWRERTQRLAAEQARTQAQATADFLGGVLGAFAPDQSGREVKVTELLDAAVLRAQSQPHLPAAVRVGLLHTIGRGYLASHRLERAQTTLERALAFEQGGTTLPPDAALALRLDHVTALSRRESFDQAVAALDAMESDPRWRDDALARQRIALRRGLLLNVQDRFADIIALLAPLPMDAAIGDAERMHREQLLARAYFLLGRLDDAEAAIGAGLAIADAGGDRPLVEWWELQSMRAMAEEQRGRLDRAEAAFRELATTMQATYGERSHPGLNAWGNVAQVMVNRGHYVEALELLDRLLPIARDIGGERSLLVLNLRAIRASALHQHGDADAALAEYDALLPLDAAERHAGDPMRLINRFNRIEALNLAGRHALALRDGEALRTDMLAAFGDGHPFVLETDDALGYALAATGHAREAEALHRRTLAAKQDALGPDNPYTLVSREYLVRALLAQGRRGDAADELAGLLDARVRALGTDHPRTAATRQLLDSARP